MTTDEEHTKPDHDERERCVAPTAYSRRGRDGDRPADDGTHERQAFGHTRLVTSSPTQTAYRNSRSADPAYT
jgi:hypothetical protein